MDENYVTSEMLKTFSFPTHFAQVWDVDFGRLRTVNENLIQAFFLDFPYQMQRDGLVILEYLANFGFATKEQLITLLDEKQGVSSEDIDKILKKYSEHNMINKFYLAYYDMGVFPEDAGIIYTLSVGGKVILSHHHTHNYSYWQVSDVHSGPIRIARGLLTGQFYLQALKHQKEDLRYFQPHPSVFVNRREIFFSASFSITENWGQKIFLLDVIRELDVQSGAWHKRVNEHISSYYACKSWQRAYPVEPSFIFLVENKEILQEVSDIFYAGIQDIDFYVTTDKEILNKSDQNIKLFKYEPNASVMNDGESKSLFGGTISEADKIIFT